METEREINPEANTATFKPDNFRSDKDIQLAQKYYGKTAVSKDGELQNLVGGPAKENFARYQKNQLYSACGKLLLQRRWLVNVSVFKPFYSRRRGVAMQGCRRRPRTRLHLLLVHMGFGRVRSGNHIKPLE